MRYRQAEIEMISKCIGVVLDHFRHLVTLATCGISCARSYRSVRDGSFGVAQSQALRASLRPCCPSGTNAFAAPRL